MPAATLSSLITVPARELSAALDAGGGQSRCCLREWLRAVPDPRKRAERWFPLDFVLALAVCAFTAAGHDSPTAITELVPMLGELDISGRVITIDALHGQRDIAEKIAGMGGYYVQVIRANQPSLMEGIAARLIGTDGEFAEESWAEEGTGHGRRGRRSIRTAPASGIDWPEAEQVFRIRRDSGPTRGP